MNYLIEPDPELRPYRSVQTIAFYNCSNICELPRVPNIEGSPFNGVEKLEQCEYQDGNAE